MPDKTTCWLRAFFAFFGIIAAAGGPAQAQSTWPARTITMVVPYAAGGGADPVARLIADGMSKRLGQAVVVSFRPGANGTIGTREAINAAPDGYTILFTPQTPVVTMKLMMRDLPYDPQRDVTPIIELARSPTAIMARRDFTLKTLKELIDYGRANPGKLNIGVPSIGGPGHLGSVLTEQLTGAKFTIIPYKGTGTLLPDMLGGTLNVSADFPAAYVSHVKSGAVRFIVVYSNQRVPALPDVPTSVESGFPDLQTGGWYALYGQRAIPMSIVQRINSVVNDVLKNPEVRSRIESLAYQVKGGTQEDVIKAMNDEYKVIGALVRSRNITMQ